MQNLAKALAGFHADVGPIHKQSDAQYGKYADLATVLSAIAPVLSKHGLCVTQTFMPFEAGTSTTLLRTTLLHTSGETVSSDLPMPSTDGARNALHAFGAATTYLRRYALLALLNLAAEDDDGASFADDPKPVAKPGTGTHKRSPMASNGARPNPNLLSDADRAALLTRMGSLDADLKKALAADMRQQFNIPANAPTVADYIKTNADAAFVAEWIRAHNTSAAVPA
jgi:hypothetical protein